MGRILQVVLTFMLAVMLAGTPSAQYAGDVGTFIAEAQKLLDRNEPAGAVLLLRRALALDPGNGPANYAIAQAQLRLGDLAEVEDHLRAAQAANFNNEEVDAGLADFDLRQARWNKILDIQAGNRRKDLEARVRTAHGYAELNLRQVSEAVQAFQQSIAIAETAELNLPQVSEAEQAFQQSVAIAKTGLAQTRIVTGDLPGAAELLEASVAMAPKRVDSWILLGRVRFLENDVPRARAAFDKAIELAPDSIVALLGRATLLVDADTKQAAEDVSAILNIDDSVPRANLLDAVIKAKNEQWRDAEAALLTITSPESVPEALFMLARVELAQGQLRQAEANITNYIALVPNDPKGLAVKGAVYSAQGKPASAIELLTKAVARMPDNVTLLGLLSEAYAKAGQTKEAADTLDRLARVAPNDAQTRIDIATQRIAIGQINEALDDLAIARAAEPLSPRAASLRIEALIAGQRLDDATKAAGELLRQSPESPIAETYLGLIDVERKDMPSGRAHFEKALKIQPTFATAAFNLAQTYRFEKRFDEARAVYDRVLEKDPNSETLLLARADLEKADQKNDAVIAFLERARTADALAQPPRLQLVSTYIARNEPARALAVAQELAQVAPRAPEAISALAEAQLANNDKQSAIANFDRVVEMTGSAPEPMLRLANVLSLAGEAQSAYRTMRRTLDLHPSDPRVQRAMLDFSMKTDNVGASTDFVRDETVRHPDAAGLMGLLAQLYEADRKYERAVAAYQTALTHGEDGVLTIGLARSQAHTPKPETALDTLSSWLAKHDDDFVARVLYAGMLMDAHQDGQAIAHYERLLAMRPKTPVLLNNLAVLYQKKGDGRALDLAEQAHALAPDEWIMADTLGALLVAKGDLTRGLPLLEQAAAKAQRPGPRYHLAVALSQAGRRDEAVRVLSEILQSGNQFDDLAAAQELMAKLGG